MSYVLQKAAERGSADHGWLQANHSFSFASYYDPNKMAFKSLRVLNDDVIQAGAGFPTHSHDNMEIITIILRGAIQHKDSMGNEYTIQAGEVQTMSAGTGVSHSEYNPLKDADTNLLQIWIEPKQQGQETNYEQKKFDLLSSTNRFQLLVSPDGRKASLKIGQDAFLSRGILSKNTKLTYSLYNNTSGIYLFVISGTVNCADFTLEQRDALAVSEVSSLSLYATTDADILVIEVP